MKNFRVTVNGKTYEVQVEEIVGGVQAPALPPVPMSIAAPTPTAAPAPTPTPAAAPSAPSGNGFKVTAPMPGSIVDIKVSVGDTVSKNQPVIILEAMKMENEIVTPVEGKVVSISTTKGSTVNSGDVLITVS